MNSSMDANQLYVMLHPCKYYPSLRGNFDPLTTVLIDVYVEADDYKKSQKIATPMVRDPNVQTIPQRHSVTRSDQIYAGH